MFRITRQLICALVFMIVCFAGTALYAAVPSMISYQGFLTNSSGTPLTGTYSIQFNLYAQPSGGTVIWTETQPSVSVTNGNFNVNMGILNPLKDTNFANNIWGPDSVRYLGIKVGSDPEISPRTRLTSVPYACAVGTINGSKGGDITGYLRVTGNNSQFISYGGQNSKALFVQQRYGDVSYGISAVSFDATGLNIGVLTSANDASVSTVSNSAAIYGIATSTYGHTIWAGYFDGWVNVTGNLYAGAKFFQIDDPQQPTERTLTHSCVESDEYKNIYDGTVILDSKGTAMVTLPEWFDDLNKDFRYQLTCIGGYASVYIDKEITNNQFMIAGGKAGLKISWQVTGVRKDAYAQAHQFSVINEKKDTQRGKYLHPKENGVSETLGIDYDIQQTQNEASAKHNAEKAAEPK